MERNVAARLPRTSSDFHQYHESSHLRLVDAAMYRTPCEPVSCFPRLSFLEPRSRTTRVFVTHPYQFRSFIAHLGLEKFPVLAQKPASLQHRPELLPHLHASTMCRVSRISIKTGELTDRQGPCILVPYDFRFCSGCLHCSGHCLRVPLPHRL
jgi:hypothetical protein